MKNLNCYMLTIACAIVTACDGMEQQPPAKRDTSYSLSGDKIRQDGLKFVVVSSTYSLSGTDIQQDDLRSEQEKEREKAKYPTLSEERKQAIRDEIGRAFDENDFIQEEITKRLMQSVATLSATMARSTADTIRTVEEEFEKIEKEQKAREKERRREERRMKEATELLRWAKARVKADKARQQTEERNEQRPGDNNDLPPV